MTQLAAEPTETFRTVTTLPPGPRWPGPVQTVWYTFAQPSFFAASRARYGPTWTMRLPNFPPLVVTRDRDAIRRLFTGDPLIRRHGNDLFKSAFGERSVMLLEPAEHLERRRTELPPFHGHAVRSYTDRIRQLITTELETWKPGRVVATHPPARAVTLEIILELVLGVRDPALQTELAGIFDSFNTPLSKLALFLPTTLGRRAWWNPIAKPAFARVDRMRGLLSAHIAHTRTDPLLGQRDDVLAVLVRARDQHGRGLSDVDLRDELVTLVAAGHETTATAMAWACDLLAHHPDVVTRLRDTLAASEREYLKATVKELLRVRTIVYVAATRQMLEPFPIGDWMLGPDVLILVDAQGVHGDPELYPEPQAFRPERFLAASPDSYAYIPFGGGAHRCLGAALATLELELFIEALVNHVDVAPAEPPARPTRRGVTLASNTHGRVRIARAHQHAIKTSHSSTVATASTRSRT
ncbi:MAG: cytochrome P450 [Solirubrobacteraceae bacterium]